ncbi:MAG: hypothetical protein R2942_02805 [Ignavibacteria bacterium]
MLLLFPEGDLGQLTELYERSPAFITMNSLVKDIGAQITDKLSGDKKLKILRSEQVPVQQHPSFLNI